MIHESCGMKYRKSMRKKGGVLCWIKSLKYKNKRNITQWHWKLPPATNSKLCYTSLGFFGGKESSSHFHGVLICGVLPTPPPKKNHHTAVSSK